MIDIHCHLLPAIDDGPKDWEQSLAMVAMMIEDDIQGAIATPHQLGAYRSNVSSVVAAVTAELRRRIELRGWQFDLFAGGDVRVEADLIDRIGDNAVTTLAETGKYVLLELPHEIYLPLDRMLSSLRCIQCRGILSHPERNQALQQSPEIISHLLSQGCLMQVTAGSFSGEFGSRAMKLAWSMLRRKQIHVIASDGHDTRRRKPLLRDAFHRVVRAEGIEVANLLFVENPSRVCRALPVSKPARRHAIQDVSGRLRSWWHRRRCGKVA